MWSLCTPDLERVVLLEDVPVAIKLQAVLHPCAAVHVAERRFHLPPLVGVLAAQFLGYEMWTLKRQESTELILNCNAVTRVGRNQCLYYTLQ